MVQALLLLVFFLCRCFCEVLWLSFAARVLALAESKFQCWWGSRQSENTESGMDSTSKWHVLGNSVNPKCAGYLPA